MRNFIFALLLITLASVALADSQKYVRPPVKQVVVTPSDVTTYNPPLASVDVGTAGDLQMVFTEDRGTFTCANAPVHKNRPNAYLQRGRIYQVCADLTTASDLTGYPVTNSP